MIRKNGFRKTSTADVRLYENDKSNNITVNNKSIDKYFDDKRCLMKALSPLKLLNVEYAMKIKVKGSGTSSQAEAVRYAISRALSELNNEFKDPLNRVGFLTGCTKQVERKKVGLVKARKRPPFNRR